MAVLDPDREQWQQLKAVLTTALKVTASARPDLLRQLLAHDPALLECALDMLQYYDTATRQFDVGAGGSVASAIARGGLPSSPEQSPVVPGACVGPYRVLRKLGEGGMGVVFLAEDQRLGRQVALKFLSRGAPALLANPRAQLLSESRSAALLNHSAIVTLHDVFEHEGELVTVMEYVEGKPLDALIGGEPLPLGFALRLIAQLADALAYAHGRGIIHCDLKPENVHVLPNGSPKILDFGLARMLAGAEAGRGDADTRLFGTPGYLAPERLLGREPSAAADVYALGVIFYQLLTGVPPFRGGDQQQLFLDTVATPPQPPSALTRGIPPTVDELVLRCLAKSPRERLQPHELARAITGILLQLETSPAALTRTSGVPVARPATTADASGAATGGAREAVRKALAASAIVAIAAVGSGLLTTWTFNVVTERPGAFDSDPFLARTIVGLRSMVYPAVIMAVTLTALSLAQFSLRAIVPARRRALLAEATLVSPATAVFGFGLVAIASVAILLVGFGDLTAALTARLGSAPQELLAPLTPDNLRQQALYRTVSSVLLAALLVAWHAMRDQDTAGDRLPAEFRGGAFGLIVVIAVLMQAPYKLTVYNQMPVALVGGLRCYVLGEHDPDVRAFCPDWEVPRVRTISRTTTAIAPCGFEENVFRQRRGAACQATR
jgi:predicted Ser/Thr protein kinase